MALARKVSAQPASHPIPALRLSPGRRALGFAVLAVIGLMSIVTVARADGPMMALPGKFSVSTTGGALYSIPIEVPPGTGGMKPELSIDYTSQSANGPMGIGWALSGIPSITRCLATLAVDGTTRGVNYTPSDNFCLSGQRLLATSGTQGAPGTQYSTEVESYSRIVSNGVDGNGPASFTVWTKSGQIMTFGNLLAYDGSNPQVSPGNGTVRSWSLTSVADVSGNMLHVIYGQPAGGAYGEYVPTEIDYTSNQGSSPPLTAYNSVVFRYGARNDVIDSYQAGVQLRTGSLLTNVQVYNGTTVNGNIGPSTLVSDYRIAYQQGSASGRSQIASVTRCGGPPDNACLPATTFGWQNGGAITNTSNTNAGGQNGQLAGYQAYLGNFDGSGRKSVMWVAEDSHNSLSTGSVYFWLAQSDGSFIVQQSNMSASAGLKPYVADFNGDGLSDVLWDLETAPTSTIPGTSTGTAYVWINQGAAAWASSSSTKFVSTTISTPIYTVPQFADFDGDGRSDILWTDFYPAVDATPYSPSVYISNGNGTFTSHSLPAIGENYQASVGDFNGDGKSDILWTPMNAYNFANGQPQIWLNSTVTNSSITFTTVLPTVNGVAVSFNNPNLTVAQLQAGQVQPGGSVPYLGDFAGNGKTDILWAGESIQGMTSGGAVWMSNGDGNFRAPSQTLSPNIGGRVAIANFTGDGRADIIWQSAMYPQLWSNGPLVVDELNDDGVLVSSTSLSPPSNAGWYPIIADFTGDGKADILWDNMDFGSRSQGTRELWLSDRVQPDLMTTITSIGATTTVQYVPLSGGASYTRFTNAVYPIEDMQSALPIVAAVYAPNGIGGSYLTAYSYGGGKVDVSGRGFLGFNYFTAFDWQTGVAEVTYTHQDYPYTGLPYWKVRMLGAGNQIFNQSTFNYAANGLGGPRYYPYLSSQLDQKTDLDGTVLPTVTTSYGQPDTNGCSPSSSATTSDGFTATTSYSYFPAYVTGASWQLCHVSQTSTISTRSAGAPATAAASVPNAQSSPQPRIVNYTVDAPTGRVMSKVVQPGAGAPLQSETDYVYDGFGHLIKTTIIPSDAGLAPRVSTLAYDATGQFVIQAVNALGQNGMTQAPVYDPRFLTVTSLYDANGLHSTSTYDSLGRKVLDVHPDQSRDAYTYSYCNGMYGGPVTCIGSAVYQMTTSHTAASGSSTIQSAPTTIGYYDVLGRLVSAASQGLDGTQTLTTSVYDANEHLYQTSRPYFTGVWVAELTTFTYDALGRVRQSVAPTPSGQSQGLVTTHSYSGLTVKDVTNGTESLTTVKDGLGEIVSVTNAQNQTTKYQYDVFSNQISIQDPQQNISTATYDLLGRRTGLIDPDMGTWSYGYDSFGELTSQKDANLNTTSLTYDALGRPLSRTETDLVSAWTYDPPGAIGKPATASASGAVSPGAAGYSRSYSYDGLVRPTGVTIAINGTSFVTGIGYDGYSRPSTSTTPDQSVATTSYNPVGYGTQTSITPAGQGGPQPVVTVTTADAELHPLATTIGNNLWTTSRGFDPATGRLTSVSTTPISGSGPTIQLFNYGYDLVGNVLQRNDGVQNVYESYGYDALNQLTLSKITNGAAVSYSYDWIGNLLSRSDVGSFTYGASGQTGPHQLLNATVSSTSPYATGFAAGTERSYTWTSFDGAASVSQGGDTLSFTYDDQHRRVTKADKLAGTTTYYVNAGGAASEIVCNGTCSGAWTGWASYLWRDYVSHGGTLAGEYTAGTGGAGAQMLYFHADGQGSVTAVTYASLAAPEQDGYDAWGKRRYMAGADDPTDAISSVTPRGFTGKEQFQAVGLVDMGSQLYDPLTTRMTSASASGGRYSYCGNNPTSCGGISLGFIGPLFSNVSALADGRGDMPEIIAASYYSVASIAAVTDAGEGINGAPGVAAQNGWEGAHENFMDQLDGGVGVAYNPNSAGFYLEMNLIDDNNPYVRFLKNMASADTTSAATPSPAQLAGASTGNNSANASGDTAPSKPAVTAGTGTSANSGTQYTSTPVNGGGTSVDYDGNTMIVSADRPQLQLVAYNGHFHDDVVDSLVQYFQGAGLTVAKEIPFRLVDGTWSARADILAQKPDKSTTFVVEVKTLDNPGYTPGQRVVYPHLMVGGLVESPSPLITQFGFAPGEPLPPILVFQFYQRGPGVEPNIQQLQPNFSQ